MQLKFISLILAAIALSLSATASLSNTNQPFLETGTGESIPTENPSTDTSTPLGEPLDESTVVQETSFLCDTSNNVPITMVRIVQEDNSLENHQVLHWRPRYFNALEAQQLCQEVSAKLQTYYDNGELEFLSLVGEQLGDQSVVCLEKMEGRGCATNGVLFVLNNNINPEEVLAHITDNELKPQNTRGHFRVRLGWLPF